jgi:colanic acid biosynthesis glycosyl transferase WcaI
VRIHVIGINYWPEETGIATFSTGRAEYLTARGHHVTMCTAVPYYPEWRVAAAYRRRPFAREQRAGVDIRRCPIYVPSQVTPVRRMLFEASFIASSFVRSVCCPKPDLLFVESPPLGLALTVAALSRLWRVPFVFQVEDLQPDAALDLGMIRRGRAARLLYSVERFAYRNAALVSTLTESMRGRIIGKGIPADKVVLFPSWADPELFTLETPAIDVPLRRELGLGNASVILHAGNMGVKQGLGVVLDAAQRTRSNPDVVYVLVGDGAVRAELEERARRAALTNVRFIPLLPRDRFLRLLALADAGLITQQRTVADIVFPSKTLVLLAAGRPVVASVNPTSEVARVVMASGAGTVVTPEAPDALAAAITRLQGAPAARARMAAAGRDWARLHWARDSTLEHLALTLESLAHAGWTGRETQ